ANVDMPEVTAELEGAYKTVQDRSSIVKFNFRKNRTLTGVFNSNKTTATELASGGFTVTGKGVVEAEGGGAVVPNDSIKLHIGNVPVIEIPLSSLVMSGTTDNDSVWTYSSKLGTVPGLA